jgi:flavin reductase (DIM6/NTAB) family NADH-FMN oxidoreductase RutF
MAKLVKRPSTALYPLPVVLVTCGSGDQANIITLAWVGTICSDPPMVGIAIRPSRHSNGLIRRTEEFVVNVPTADLVAQADYCGQVSGRDVDKWAACGFTPQPGSAVATPLIAQCPVNLECKLAQIVPLGAHDLFVGEIVAVQLDEAILDDKGRIDYAKARPFAYLGGQYREIGELLGQYGDWREEPLEVRRFVSS